MKVTNKIQSIVLMIVVGLVFANAVFAQKNDDDRRVRIAQVEKNQPSGKIKAKNSSEPIDVEEDVTAKEDDDETKEGKKVVLSYGNYLDEYRLGANDIISIEVFGQCPDYCVTDKTIPPTAKMSYPLIREGVFVGGKTVEDVADDVTKKLEEYIIDPKVTVTLVRAGSARYSVMGKVNAPGVRIMDRKVSINEAILEAGGVSKEGTKKKVFIARINPQGFYSTEEIDLIGIETGKIPTMFLQPGDQVFVGDKGLTFGKVLDYIGKFSAARVLFGGGLF